MNRRQFLLSGLTAATGVALLGSGAFSETESKRNVTIETVGDEDAYLRLAYDSPEVVCEENVEIVDITNHFPSPIDTLDVPYTVAGAGATVQEFDVPRSLDVGESGEVTATVECDSAEQESVTIQFDVVAEGERFDVTVEDREVTVECHCPAEDNESGESNGTDENEAPEGSDGSEKSEPSDDGEGGEENPA